VVSVNNKIIIKSKGFKVIFWQVLAYILYVGEKNSYTLKMDVLESIVCDLKKFLDLVSNEQKLIIQ